MGLRHRLVGLLPRRWELPLRYWYTAAGGRIDREAKILASLIRPGSTALDIGAHAGLVTYLFARSGAARVEAFEPLQRWREVLEAWARSGSTVRAHATACSDHEGEFTLHIPFGPNGELQHSRASVSVPTGPHVSETVRTTSLDAIVAREGITDVSVIKIDVEGHEDAVIRGGAALLRRDGPTLMIEIERRHRSEPPELAFELLGSLGYEGSFVAPDGRRRPVSEFRADVHQREPGAKDYINNFLFTSKARGR